MQIFSDPTVRQKIVVMKNDQRVFSLEYPCDADISEVYGIVSEIKEQLWNSLESSRAQEAEKVLKEKEEAKDKKKGKGKRKKKVIPIPVKKDSKK